MSLLVSYSISTSIAKSYCLRPIYLICESHNNNVRRKKEFQKFFKTILNESVRGTDSMIRIIYTDFLLFLTKVEEKW